MQIYTIDDFRRMPWANGGGMTCELFRLPHPARPEAFAMRFSVAEVESGGPFSHFPGIDRHLGLLDGGGMALERDDGGHLLLDGLGQVVSFAGEIGVQCRLLAGPLRDCNLMLARDWGRGELARLAPAHGETVRLAAADVALLYLQRGEWTRDGQALPSGGLLLLENEAASLLAGRGAVAWRATVRRVRA